PKGILLINNTNNIIYETIEDKEITNVSTTVMVIATTAGKIGNCSAGQINTFKEIYPGLTAVTNETEITGAIDKETDDEYRDRLLNYIQKPQISWNKYVFEEEAKVIKEIDKSKCIPIGGGEVKLIVTQKNSVIATNEVKTKVYNYINNKILSDINLVVDSVEIFDIQLSIEAVINQDYNNENSKDELTEALNKFFFNKVFETRILYFDIANQILNCKSIDKLSDLKINGIKDDLLLSENQLAVIKTITIGGIE
ncbi:MAG: baseplate J/gp47 family protein, partial [Cetobacterium sp.]